ncbi:MAG: zinc ribbon domain-containing protein, partial [Pyrinomonadaceae bacterium]
IWLTLAWLFKQFFGEPSVPPPVQTRPTRRCPNCNSPLPSTAIFCSGCGLPKPLAGDLFKDLAATERQIERFHNAGQLDAQEYANLKARIEEEKRRLSARDVVVPPPPVTPVEKPIDYVQPQPESATRVEEQPVTPLTQPPPSVVTASFVATEDSVVIEPTPSFMPPPPGDGSGSGTTFEQPTPAFTPPREPRRSFAEMLNSFMEESNIRWGEIVGGLLIIGCSTALVVSLWSQISQIPVLKFLIFTTVTAALFGIGLYTEHRWKLPTTSRGILTIATLLVPLNFLAIAAVSAGTESPGALIIGSELIAPVVFLCLVYFSGRVLTPSWPHLLGVGVLGSSIGQLLIRHFASPEVSPGLLVTLGAVPVICYVASTVWMLRKVLADHEIDENETIAVFISLGAMTFATVLPFGLLLYKTGPIGMTMMYLAPLVSLGGFPLLATGTLLWQRIAKKELVASRTAGTSIAILGVLIVLSGMVLAWPNPASIVPAALFNFAVFTTLAVLLNIPQANLIGSACFGLAYLVLFHVIAGHVGWQNLRVTSLLRESLSLSSGQALAALFVLFLATSEWLARKRTKDESNTYLVSACAVAVISLALIRGYGQWLSPSTHELWPVFAIYALGAFWIDSRVKWVGFSWIGSLLLLAAFIHPFAASRTIRFPVQAALLAHATVCAAGAILAWYFKGDLKRILTRPLYQSALMTSFLAVVCLVQARPWQTTAEEAQSVFWLAGIWLALLWVVRHRALFAVFQIALTCGVVLSVKGVLQQYDWYAYLPHAFLHPWGLQIQGTALVLLSLGWIAVHLALKSEKFKIDKLKFVGHLVDGSWTVDRLITWAVLVGFIFLALYGALPGVTRELTAEGTANPSWNIAGFPHEEAFAIGSWIMLGLLVVAMLASAWESRRSVYVLGAVVALTAITPLLAGRFETEIATASAWRWLAALLLLLASIPLLFRDRVLTWLRSFGWPQTDVTDAELTCQVRALLLMLTLAPLVVLTAYPALRAVYYMPVHGPASGFFHLLNDSFSYGAPLVIVALVLIAYAVREHLPAYAFAGGLLFNVTATMTHLLSLVAVKGSMDRVVMAQAIQINAIVFGLCALVWLALFPRWNKALSEDEAREARQLLTDQIILAIAAK